MRKDDVAKIISLLDDVVKNYVNELLERVCVDFGCVVEADCRTAYMMHEYHLTLEFKKIHKLGKVDQSVLISISPLMNGVKVIYAQYCVNNSFGFNESEDVVSLLEWLVPRVWRKQNIKSPFNYEKILDKIRK